MRLFAVVRILYVPRCAVAGVQTGNQRSKPMQFCYFVKEQSIFGLLVGRILLYLEYSSSSCSIRLTKIIGKTTRVYHDTA